MVGPRSRLSLLFVLLFLISRSSSSPSAANVLEGTVVKIADGDTITVLDSDKVQHRVRVAGIDAPEKGQPFGNASTKRLRELVARKEVRVEFHKHDRYGRIVGKVMVTPPDCPSCGKTLDVGLAQFTTGMAWWYRQYSQLQIARGPVAGGKYPVPFPRTVFGITSIWNRGDAGGWKIVLTDKTWFHKVSFRRNTPSWQPHGPSPPTSTRGVGCESRFSVGLPLSLFLLRCIYARKHRRGSLDEKHPSSRKPETGGGRCVSPGVPPRRDMSRSKIY